VPFWNGQRPASGSGPCFKVEAASILNILAPGMSDDFLKKARREEDFRIWIAKEGGFARGNGYRHRLGWRVARRAAIEGHSERGLVIAVIYSTNLFY
jgi:hypothetical protein